MKSSIADKGATAQLLAQDPPVESAASGPLSVLHLGKFRRTAAASRAICMRFAAS